MAVILNGASTVTVGAARFVVGGAGLGLAVIPHIPSIAMVVAGCFACYAAYKVYKFIEPALFLFYNGVSLLPKAAQKAAQVGAEIAKDAGQVAKSGADVFAESIGELVIPLPQAPKQDQSAADQAKEQVKALVKAGLIKPLLEHGMARCQLQNEPVLNHLMNGILARNSLSPAMFAKNTLAIVAPHALSGQEPGFLQDQIAFLQQTYGNTSAVVNQAVLEPAQRVVAEVRELRNAAVVQSQVSELVATVIGKNGAFPSQAAPFIAAGINTLSNHQNLIAILKPHATKQIQADSEDENASENRIIATASRLWNKTGAIRRGFVVGVAVNMVCPGLGPIAAAATHHVLPSLFSTGASSAAETIVECDAEDESEQEAGMPEQDPQPISKEKALPKKNFRPMSGAAGMLLHRPLVSN